jgi:hypothetical protein
MKTRDSSQTLVKEDMAIEKNMSSQLWKNISMWEID